LRRSPAKKSQQMIKRKAQHLQHKVEDAGQDIRHSAENASVEIREKVADGQEWLSDQMDEAGKSASKIHDAVSH